VLSIELQSAPTDGVLLGQLLVPTHIQARLTHAQPAFPYLQA
jgi:hypothetical protein